TETCRGLTGAPRLARQASMEPSRERDGDTFDPEESPATEALASMEPSRERDGDRASCPSSGAPLARFNGAVARTRRRHRAMVAPRHAARASMEPSRERDGDARAALARPAS